VGEVEDERQAKPVWAFVEITFIWKILGRMSLIKWQSQMSQLEAEFKSNRNETLHWSRVLE